MTASQTPSVALAAPIFTKHQTNYQPNFFTESRQEFTELERNIVTLVTNQIGHMAIRGEIKLDSNIRFRIPYSELTAKRYDQIANAAETLQTKRIGYRHDKSQKFDFITPFPRVRSEVIDGKKVIEVTMFADVVPHFAALGQRYTKYECDIMLSLGSVYAKRMFDIVSMYVCRGQYIFTYQVDELMEMLNCPDSYRYVDFKINALDLAKRELQQKANIILDYTPSAKEGKKVIALTFSVKTSLQLAAEAVNQDRQAINQMSINEAVTTAWQLMKGYQLKPWQKDLIVSDQSLLETFYRVDSELANGLRTNVKNPTAYLIKSLGIDQQKAPKKTAPVKSKPAPVPAPMLPFGTTERTATTQSFAAVLGNLIMNESK